MARHVLERPPSFSAAAALESGATGVPALELRIDRRNPVVSQIHAALREAIVTTRLLPGTPISENSLCKQFQVSRTPVRAAIQRLSEEGLVEVFPQLGSFVSRLNLDDIQDSQFVRRTLEVGLLREAARLWEPMMGRTMRSIIAAQANAIEDGDISAFHVEDDRFHRHFAFFAQRPGVLPALHAAKAPLTRFFRITSKPERLRAVLVEHGAIVDALDAGDEEGAAEALVAHLDRIFVLVAALPEEERLRFFP